MGKLVITRDEQKNQSSRYDIALCPRERTSGDCGKKAVFDLGNLRSIR
jgi:hypothetical protein